MGALAPQSLNYKAWVVFTDKTDLPILRVLKRGYRHCFVLIHTGTQWIKIEPLSNRMCVGTHPNPEFDYPAFVEFHGDQAIPAQINHSTEKNTVISLLTCVSATKRILGLHNPFIITPAQLHKHLTKGI